MTPDVADLLAQLQLHGVTLAEEKDGSLWISVDELWRIAASLPKIVKVLRDAA